MERYKKSAFVLVTALALNLAFLTPSIYSGDATIRKIRVGYPSASASFYPLFVTKQAGLLSHLLICGEDGDEDAFRFGRIGGRDPDHRRGGEPGIQQEKPGRCPVELAVHKFRDLILGLKGDFEGFDSITKVYLDNCIEVKKMLPQGALAAFVENLGEPSPSVSTELPGVSADFCMSYGWIAEEEDEEEEGRVVEPFVKFDK